MACQTGSEATEARHGHFEGRGDGFREIAEGAGVSYEPVKDILKRRGAFGPEHRRAIAAQRLDQAKAGGGGG